MMFRYKFHTFPLNPEYFPPESGPLANDPYTVRDTPQAVNNKLASGGLMSNTVKSIRPLGSGILVDT
jgi:tyrosinase